MKKLNGFTLFELMIVIAIIGMIAAFVAPSLMGSDDPDASNEFWNKQSVKSCLNEAELTLAECQQNADYLFPVTSRQSAVR